MSQTRARLRAYPDLKTWRAEHGYSQEQAATKLGISQTYYSRLERGVQLARRSILKRILTETGVPAEVLLGVTR